MQKSLSDIHGVTLEGVVAEQDLVLRVLNATLPVAAELVSRAAGSAALSPLAIAANAALHSVTSLVAAAAPKCNLDSPAEDIDVRMDGNGNIIYRCRHRSPHEWDLAGNRRP
jgi:hypothetical protein